MTAKSLLGPHRTHMKEDKREQILLNL